MGKRKSFSLTKYRFGSKFRSHTRSAKRSCVNAEHLTDQYKYITNLSSKRLTEPQIQVLSMGLKFIPSSSMHKDHLNGAVSDFCRSNRIKHFFRNEPPSKPHPFKPKSKWVPPKASADVENYLQRVENTLTSLQPITYQPNLTTAQKRALKELSEDTSIVIKSADKGSGIVVENRSNYIRDGLAHLSDTKIYKKVEKDPTEQLGKGINEFINTLYRKGIIDKVHKDYLTFPTDKPPRTQQMYFLKKIHKSPTAVRPICSSCGGPTEKISQMVDMHIQPFVPKIKSYLRDSGHLIDILENTQFPKDCILATVDVKAMYTNIPHKEGIKSVLNRVYTNNPDSEDMQIPQSTMSDLLTIVLANNYFQFADSMYHQVQGTAMGTKMAPAYANLFMAELEERLLQHWPEKPTLWKRYIDDIILIWPGNSESLNAFMDFLNEAHPTIKFTHTWSATQIDFLDITIYKGNRFATSGRLDTKPFFKSTNKFQYLPYNSAHPKSVFRSLIKGELTRLLRASSSEDTYKQVVSKMTTIFRNRNYPPYLIRKTIKEVPFSNRKEILSIKTKQPCKHETFLVLNYTPDLDTREIQKIIRPTETEEETVPKPCLSLRKTKNLATKLVRAKLSGIPVPIKDGRPLKIPWTPIFNNRSAGCNTPMCKCCRAMSGKINIFSQKNYKPHLTAAHSNCNTCNIIYLIECKKCQKNNQYVGQTQRPLKQRIAGHRAAFYKKPNLPIYKHFAGKDHNFERDISVSVLEKATPDRLLERESHWINLLDTVYPKGLNSRFELTGETNQKTR